MQDIDIMASPLKELRKFPIDASDEGRIEEALKGPLGERFGWGFVVFVFWATFLVQTVWVSAWFLLDLLVVPVGFSGLRCLFLLAFGG